MTIRVTGGALALAAFSAACVGSPVPAYGDEWELYLATDFILDVSADSSGVWAATPGGAVHLGPDGTLLGRLSALDGLPSNRLRAVARGHDGDLWFGTMGEGLGRSRDAEEDWWVYGGPEGLFSEEVIVIHPVSDGVWVGTAGGVAKFIGDEREADGPSRYNANTGLLADSVLTVLEHEGSLWFGTSGGLSQLHPDSGWVPHLDVPQPIQVNALAVDGTGAIWGGTRVGVVRWDGGAWQLVNAGLPATDIRDIEMVEGTPWVAAAAPGGVARWDGGVWVAENEGLASVPPDAWSSARSLSYHPQGGLWVGTEAGLARWEDSLWVRAPVPAPVSNYVMSIGEDSEGGVWIATGSDNNLFKYGDEEWAGARGVSRWKDGGWRTYNSTNSGLINDFAYRVVGDAEGRVWIGTWGQGISRFDLSDSSWFTYAVNETVAADSSPQSNVIADLAVDEQGHLWVAAYLVGVSVLLDDDSWLHFLPGGGLPSTPAYKIPRSLALHHEVVWVGNHVADEPSEFGIALLDTRGTPADPTDDVVTDYPPGGNWSSVEGTVNDLCAESGGTIWAATASGVTSFNGETWRNYARAEGGEALGEVRAVAVDHDGNRWFATRQGLLRLEPDGETWHRYDTGNSGLPWDDVMSLHVGSATGALWIGTWGGGLARLRLAPAGETGEEDRRLVVGPNPFRPAAGGGLIFPELEEGAVVRIYTLAGSLVRELGASEEKVWDGRDSSGRRVASGVYLVVGESRSGGVRRAPVAVLR